VFVAAEALEFSGLLRHAERVVKLNWPLDFARKIWLSGHAVILVANGPGPKLAAEAVEIAKGRERLTGIVSTGFCGALDPALNLSDIFIPTELLDFVVQVKVGQALPPAKLYQSGPLLSTNRVAITSAEKSELHKTTGARAIEMEAAGVSAKSQQYNLPFYCIRVVTDTAGESLPLDFNQMRDANGRFSRSKIIFAALRRPTVFPKLLNFNNRCKNAAQALGDFIADTRF
jgi:adenosylhomocysteine nucleosidase